MIYLEKKKNIFRNLIGDLYYYGCLGYDEITIIGILYFKNELNKLEINKNEIISLVHKEINSLIDLD